MLTESMDNEERNLFQDAFLSCDLKWLADR